MYSFCWYGVRLLFTGCMVGKKYTRPAETATISYPDATKTDTSALATWFEIYHDTALQSLIKWLLTVTGICWLRLHVWRKHWHFPEP